MIKKLAEKAREWCLEYPHHRYVFPENSDNDAKLILHPNPNSIDCFSAGYSLCEKEMLEKASEGVEAAFKNFSFKEHPFTEEEWAWYLNFHPAGLDTFKAGYEAASLAEKRHNEWKKDFDLELDLLTRAEIEVREKELTKLKQVIKELAEVCEDEITGYIGLRINRVLQKHANVIKECDVYVYELEK